MQDAFAAAVEQWAEDGIPSNARSWLISTGRFKAIDRARRTSRFDSIDASTPEAPEVNMPEYDETGVEDDRLKRSALRFCVPDCFARLKVPHEPKRPHRFVLQRVVFSLDRLVGSRNVLENQTSDVRELNPPRRRRLNLPDGPCTKRVEFLVTWNPR